MKISKPIKEEIIVFAFKKYSQYRFKDSDNSSYRFVNASLEKMISGHDTISCKIGISGYREDLVSYISGLIDIYMTTQNFKIDKVENFEQVDFDPDIDDTIM